MAKPKAFWPVVITDANKTIALPAANLATGTYYSAADLATAVRTALGGAYTVTVSATGRFTIGHPTTPFQLSIVNVALAGLLGFATTPYSSALSHTAPSQHGNGWYSDRGIGVDLGPEFDSASSAATVSLSGVVKVLQWPERELRTLTFSNVPSHKTKIDYEGAALSLDGAAHTNEAIERLWRAGRGRFRYWPDGTVEGTYIDLCFYDDAIKSFKPQRHPRKALYTWTWNLRKYVAG